MAAHESATRAQGSGQWRSSTEDIAPSGRPSLTARIAIGSASWLVDMSAPIDLSILLDPHGQQPRAFSLPAATAAPVQLEGFIGDTRHGSCCNCEVVTIAPHGNGTHTECVGHITKDRISIAEVLDEAFTPATLLTVELETLGAAHERYPAPGAPGDLVLTRRALERAWSRIDARSRAFTRGLVVRTLPNAPDKLLRDWSGGCPPYPTNDAVAWMVERGVHHVCLDLPSLDREDDGGKLSNHRRFWAGAERLLATVTEMAFIDNSVKDGLYLLSIQVPPLALDAAPSRPLLFRARPALEST